MFERVVPCHSRCSRSPTERIIFLDFMRSDTQIESEQNTVSITAPSLFDISSAMKGVG